MTSQRYSGKVWPGELVRSLKTNAVVVWLIFVRILWCRLFRIVFLIIKMAIELLLSTAVVKLSILMGRIHSGGNK